MTPFDFYLVRCPDLPLSVLNRLNDHDADEVLKKMNSVFSCPEVQEAIFFASPEFYHRLMEYKDKSGVMPEKLQLSLYKYLARMSSRCTPFGMFSGVFPGRIAEGCFTEMMISKKRVALHYDLDYLAELSSRMLKEDDFRSGILFSTNHTLYDGEGDFRYYESQPGSGTGSTVLTSLKHTTILKTISLFAKKGKRFEELVRLLLDHGIGESAGGRFLEELIARQFLVSELEPNFDTKAYFHLLKSKQAQFSGDKRFADFSGLEQLLDRNTSLIEKTRQMDFPYKNHFSLDQVYEGKNVIHQKIIDSITREVKEMEPFFFENVSPDLLTFKRKFESLYQGEPVRLTTALDKDYGIGYGDEEHLSDLNILSQVFQGKKASESTLTRPVEEFILNKYNAMLSSGQVEMVIEEADLVALKEKAADKGMHCPATFYLMGNLFASKLKENMNRDFVFNLSAISGPSCLNLMSRFAEADKGLLGKLRDCAEYENQFYEGAVVAELVHSPKSQISNILKRPAIRDYQIVLLNSSPLSGAVQIPVDDLYLSMNKGKLRLWSKALGKEIIPRMSTAHNYTGDTVIYKFLCELQHQDLNFSFKWNWGNLRKEPHLPRVRYKHLILSRAQWIFDHSIAKSLEEVHTLTDRDRFRNRYKLPQKVLLCEGDNELLIDFYSPVSISILKSRLKTGKLRLCEFLYGSYPSVLKDDFGNQHANEVIIPYKGSAGSFEKAKNPFVAAADQVVRKFLPGSEWLSVKIYCSSSSADQLINRQIKQLVAEAKAGGLLEKWFFLRFYDPDHHLRLRLQLREGAGHGISDLVQAVFSGPLHNGMVKSLQYDTYNRELERYGAGQMGAVEHFFYRDSELIGRIIERALPPEARIEGACFLIDQLLTYAGLAMGSKMRWASKMFDSFFSEFAAEEKIGHKLNVLYREKGNIGKVLSRSDFYLNQEGFKPELEYRERAFNEWLKSILQVPDGLAEGTRLLEGQLLEEQLLEEQLGNLSHMMINRLFAHHQRRYELIVYHFMMKYYRTCRAHSGESKVRIGSMEL